MGGELDLVVSDAVTEEKKCPTFTLECPASIREYPPPNHASFVEHGRAVILLQKLDTACGWGYDGSHCSY